MRILARSALAAAAAFCLLFCLLACDRVQEREEYYPDGTRKSLENYEVREGDTLLHGLRTVWYPDGKPESSERFIHGRRQGYAIRWHENGQMRSVEHYTDGEADGQAMSWDGQGGLLSCYDAESGDCLRTAGGTARGTERLAARP
jgi:antitoxin component YwqK of YwqJK toxin-antitoxin module